MKQSGFTLLETLLNLLWLGGLLMIICALMGFISKAAYDFHQQQHAWYQAHHFDAILASAFEHAYDQALPKVYYDCSTARCSAKLSKTLLENKVYLPGTLPHILAERLKSSSSTWNTTSALVSLLNLKIVESKEKIMASDTVSVFSKTRLKKGMQMFFSDHHVLLVEKIIAVQKRQHDQYQIALLHKIPFLFQGSVLCGILGRDYYYLGTQKKTKIQGLYRYQNNRRKMLVSGLSTWQWHVFGQFYIVQAYLQGVRHDFIYHT